MSLPENNRRALMGVIPEPGSTRDASWRRQALFIYALSGVLGPFNDTIPEAFRGPLDDADIIGPVSGFMRQRPKQFITGE